MHSWGDAGVDWEGIGAAADYIERNLRRWGRMSAHGKEKFGTVRVYCIMGWHQFHDIAYPGYVYRQCPKWLWNLDCSMGWHLVKPLNWIGVPWQRWLYKRLYRNAVKRWPHIRREILCAADWPELLKGI